MAAAHNAELRARVMEALMTGQGVREVARQFKISSGTVCTWRKDAGLNGHTPLKAEKRQEIGELVAGYLRENLTTLQFQAKEFRNPTFFKGKDAAQFAVLHGVLFDKAIRLLEAFEPQTETERHADPPPDEVPT